MITSNGEDSKMSWRRAKTTGWAAFDLQQRQKDIVDARSSNEPFPSLPSNTTSVQPSASLPRNNHLYVKPFPSVIVPSVDFPDELGNEKSKPLKVGSSIVPPSTRSVRDNKNGSVFKQLKEHYSWADDGLIEDVMAAVDNDFDRASSFLEAMVSDESLEKNEQNEAFKSSRDSMEKVSNENTLSGKREIPSENIVESDSEKSCSINDSHMEDNIGNMKGEFNVCSKKLSDGCLDINSILGQLAYVPTEPEWEEDDVYLSCRKDAIKMMRAAARHSKSATNAFQRGDHFAAQQFSQKAQEEWTAAKKLNEKAAREILSIRNENNGLWRLDLHGLHASEAVQAVQERLLTFEAQIFSKGSNNSVISNSLRNKSVALNACSSGYDNKMERSDQHAFFGQKPKWLEVITGIGNHSRGGAALPTAVKTFLADNGYRFDEARPGVIMVRPKFRHV